VFFFIVVVEEKRKRREINEKKVIERNGEFERVFVLFCWLVKSERMERKKNAHASGAHISERAGCHDLTIADEESLRGCFCTVMSVYVILVYGPPLSHLHLFLFIIFIYTCIFF
jgi:hypothetical protein